MRTKADVLAAASPPAEAQRRDGTPSVVAYYDLGAHVYLDHVPEELVAELPGLYHSLFSTLDWFAVNDHRPDGACVLDEPRHVVLFSRSDAELSVLNQAFACTSSAANRICAALFRALPQVQRVVLDASFATQELDYPVIVSRGLETMVVDLPPSVNGFCERLNKSTRRNLHRREHLLLRSFPDLTQEVVAPGERSRELIAQLAAWKADRFHQQGRATYWETRPRYAEQVVKLLERCGEAQLVSIHGRLAAIRVCFRVGNTAYAYESASDPLYSDFSLGRLTLYWFTAGAIESGATRLNLLAGSSPLKLSFGARPEHTRRALVFRSRPAELLGLDAVLHVLKTGAGTRIGQGRHALRLWAHKYWLTDALARRITGRGIQ